MNLFSLLSQSARRYPENGAVFLGETQVLTFAQLERRAQLLAGGLTRVVRPGDRIVIASKNTPEYIELLFAIWAAGLVAVPVNAKLHAREMGQIIEDAEPSLIFASDQIAAELAPILKAGDLDPVIVAIGSEAFEVFASGEAVAPADVSPDTLAWLFFTSGTTGRSKGAMLSHRNLMAMTAAYLADFGPVEVDYSMVHSAPMSHGSGLYMLPLVSRAARQVIPTSGGYSPDEFVDLCCCHPNVVAFLAPTMVQRLRLQVERDGRKPDNLNTIIYGGGPMYVSELRKSMATLGDVFCQLFGQGEAPMTITGLRRRDHRSDDENVLGSVGWARFGVEVAIFDSEDSPLPPGEVGEIVCRGDVVMSGYWKNSNATEEALRNGWLHTGDIGVLDQDGKLTLKDRSKDVIISGGINIYPREVEETLLSFPGVAEVAVVGKPDTEWGEIVIAFVVAESGQSLEESLLDNHCLEHIARFKRPKHYLFVDALPKNHYGKVLKRELIAQFKDRSQISCGSVPEKS